MSNKFLFVFSIAAGLLFFTQTSAQAQVISLRNQTASQRPVAPGNTSLLLEEGKRLVAQLQRLKERRIALNLDKDAIDQEVAAFKARAVISQSPVSRPSGSLVRERARLLEKIDRYNLQNRRWNDDFQDLSRGIENWQRKANLK